MLKEGAGKLIISKVTNFLKFKEERDVERRGRKGHYFKSQLFKSKKREMLKGEAGKVTILKCQPFQEVTIFNTE